MIIETKEISVDEFEEVGEFEMPLEMDYILNVNIDREVEILNEYARRNGYKGFSVTKGD